MKNPDIFIALTPFIKILNKLSVPYYIGGSIASSIYGIPRVTIDIDIVADIKNEHVSKMKDFLGNEYYVDEDMIREAIQQKSTFNLIHYETAMKIDVFIQKDDSYNRNAARRKLKDTLVSDQIENEFYFASPEDIIINKLYWYKIGNFVSERQYLDIIGVIKIQSDSLDFEYLKKWTKKLGLFTLFKKAVKESGIKFAI